MDNGQLNELINQKYKAAKRQSTLRGLLMVLLVLILLCALVFAWISFKRMRDNREPVPSPSPIQQTESPAPIPSTPSPTEHPEPAVTGQPEPVASQEPAVTGQPEPAASQEPVFSPAVEPSAAPAADIHGHDPAETLLPSAVTGEPELLLHRISLLWPDSVTVPTQPISVRVRYRDEVVTELTLRPEEAWTADWKDPYPAEQLNLEARFPSGVNATVTVVGERFDVSCQVSDVFRETEPAPTVESHKLPQTGVQTWPITMLLVLGFLLIGMAGLLFLRHE